MNLMARLRSACRDRRRETRTTGLVSLRSGAYGKCQVVVASATEDDACLSSWHEGYD